MKSRKDETRAPIGIRSEFAGPRHIQDDLSLPAFFHNRTSALSSGDLPQTYSGLAFSSLHPLLEGSCGVQDSKAHGTCAALHNYQPYPCGLSWTCSRGENGDRTDFQSVCLRPDFGPSKSSLQG